VRRWCVVRVIGTIFVYACTPFWTSTGMACIALAVAGVRTSDELNDLFFNIYVTDVCFLT
jgi:hypothetical protein